METEETGTRIKARKRTPTPPVMVEVKVQPPEPPERGPLSPDEATEVLEEIRSLLPWGYRCFVPDLRARRGSDRVIDFEQLLEKLGLPHFAKGYSPDWERYFARDVKDKQQLMICLSALFEAGYGCAPREGDVYQASWLLLYGNEVWPSRVRGEISERDTHVVDRAELDEWTRTRLATVRASLGTVASSFKTGAWNPQGVLKKLGYRVGTCARPPSERQARLRDALLLPTALLPRGQHALWGGRWDRASSPRYLQDARVVSRAREESQASRHQSGLQTLERRLGLGQKARKLIATVSIAGSGLR
jgi:hypothetical protein